MSQPNERYVATAPMRIDFAGGYTDVTPFTEDEGGAVANLAIELRTCVELRLGGAGIRLASRELREELVFKRASELVYDGRLDLLKATLNLLPVAGPLRLETRSEGPPNSGLGGSGALGVALIAALAAARQERYEPEELAELAFMAETGEIGIRGGRQDQYAAAFGGAHLFTFDADNTVANPLSLSAGMREALERHLVVVYLGESRLSGRVHDRVWAAYEADDGRVREALLGMRGCADDAAAALAGEDLAALGDAMLRNWGFQTSLAAEIETKRMAEFSDIAERCGVMGGKACGAGGGGCMVFLTEERARLESALTAAGGEIVPVKVAREGVRLEMCERTDS